LLTAGGVFPGTSSFDAGLEEFLLFRDSTYSSLASFAARTSFASIKSAICPAIAVICPS